jgi:hypothetical protein
MSIALVVLLIAAIAGSVVEGRTHARLARTTTPAPALTSVCHYCGEPAPHDNTFPLCKDCEAAELAYLNAN